MSADKQYNLISELYQDPQGAGKHVIVIGWRVYATKTGEAKSLLLKRLTKEHPNDP